MKSWSVRIHCMEAAPSLSSTHFTRSLGNLAAMNCHLWTSFIPCSGLKVMEKTVTRGGTLTSLTFQAAITPKLAPPPPLIAQKRSSPIVFLSRILPFTSTNRASTTLSAASPCFLIIVPIPPPLKCPPTPTLGYNPAENPTLPPLSLAMV